MGRPKKTRITEAEAVEQINGYLQTIEHYRESLVELEMALEDGDQWRRLTGEGEQQFSREGLRKICGTALIQWLANPLVKRAVATQTQYVFAQGVTIKARNKAVDEVVRAFFDHPKNKAELGSHQSRGQKETELQLSANLFFALIPNPTTGRVIVRTIPFEEIDDVIFNPEDSRDPWYYKRSWTETDINGKQSQRVAFYPDFRHDPASGARPDGEVVEDVFVYHVAVNRLAGMKFGVSEIYAASQWAKSYGDFLKDWATITKALSRFAWRMTTKGGKAGIAQAKKALVSRIGAEDVSRGEQNVGGFLVESEGGSKMEPMKTAGAQVKMDDGRRLLLMVSAATGVFEHYFGDPSTGNLATTKSMERPMELMFLDRQALWADVFADLAGFAVKWAIKAPKGKLSKLGSVETDEDGVEIIQWIDDPEAEGKQPIDGSIDVLFPPILEKEAKDRIAAIISAATLDGKAPAETLDIVTVTRMLLSALGEDNIEDKLREMFPDGKGEWPKKEMAQAIANGDNPFQGNEQTAMESRANSLMISTLSQVREVLTKLATSQEAA